MKKMVFLALALVALISECSNEEGLQQVGGADRLLAGIIDSLVSAEIEPGGPGCAIAVIREGEIIFKRGYGIAKLDYGMEANGRFPMQIMKKLRPKDLLRPDLRNMKANFSATNCWPPIELQSEGTDWY
ncbi:MAG: hypothetical protein FVQ81_00960 [Candidatus Glassbacteria bacterium]|nr:hypothetical protein [Candidatus Glassbacteria bacterium]